MGKLISLEHFPQISIDCGNYESLCEPGNYTIFTISSLLYVMNRSLPIEDVPSTRIILSEDSPNPICYRDYGFIILASNPDTWNRLAYQLAHEMSHRTIPNDVPENIRWLEESICELASYYFLESLSKYWEEQNINFKIEDTNELYYSKFKEYVDLDSKKATSFDFSTFASDNPPHILNELVENCEDRKRNAHIANNLLPIFNQYPDTWSAIPYLGKITPNLSFQDSLREWIKISPESSRIGLRKLAKIFGAEFSQY